MAKLEIISGQKSIWQIQHKMGEGDAGEIYQVASMSSTLTAYLKRPVMSAFRGDIFRQSSQIRNEGRIISALNNAAEYYDEWRIEVPRLLDQSKPGPEYNQGNFIIIEKAEGMDLGLLARVARKGLDSQEELELSSSEEGRALLLEIASSGGIPESLITDILMRLAHFLGFIHHLKSDESGKPSEGIIWNDVKPDHLFWNPETRRLTVIDWGNARFLDSDQTIVNHQFTWMDDFRQFFDEMGKYLNENAPALLEELGWADFSGLKTIPPHSIEEIITRLSDHYKKLTQPVESEVITNRRRKSLSEGVQITAEDIQAIQNLISDFGTEGEFQIDGGPEYWMRYLTAFSGQLARQDRLDDLIKLSRWVSDLQNIPTDYWTVLEILVIAARGNDAPGYTDFLEIIRNAAAMEWEDVLWQIAVGLPPDSTPEWREELTLHVRRLALGDEQAAVRPLQGLWRIYYTLQSLLIANEDGREDNLDFQPEYVRELMRQIAGEIIPNWSLMDPTPPDTRLDYRAVMQVITEAITMLPEKEQKMMMAVFSAPSARVEEVLAFWENKAFPKAAELIRYVLVCDPDRIRVLRAEKCIRECGKWLKHVEAGPEDDDVFIDWVFDVEFHAAELRSQVGPATWLERILDGCRMLQKGQWPADLVKASSDLALELPWLAAFDRRENMPGLEQSEQAALTQVPVFDGVEECRVGLDEPVSLVGPLDAWTPEARGSSARVLSGILKIDGEAADAAVKIMRMDQVQYALPLFREEAVILSRLADAAGVGKMIECGYIQLDDLSEFPLEAGYGRPPARGKALRIGPGMVAEFLNRLDEQISSGWTPYLAIEKQDQDDNLLFACDAGVTRGRFQPVPKLLKMVVQICDILEIAHSRGIVYRDHKILHYYWNNLNNRLTLIDWNVARLRPKGLRDSDIEMDIVQFGARGMHHILTGRTAPGALPLGPTRPEEIEAAAHTYKTHWTYDDARLPLELKEIMERVLSGGYTAITDLRDDLKKTLVFKPAANSIPAVE